MSMNDPERPPLDAVVWEEIADSLHRIDELNWRLIAEFRVARFIPSSIPVPPHRPLHLLNVQREYATELLTAEADHYEPFLADGRYPAWIARLENRVLERVLKGVQQVEDGDPKATIGFHGLDHYKMVNELKGALWDRANGYRWRVPGSGVSPQALPPLAKAIAPKSPPVRQRMSATVHSPSAARKMEAHLATKGIGLTDFASTAGTTDRTLRSFRKTGNIRRSILAGIASAMGTSMENLLKQ